MKKYRFTALVAALGLLFAAPVFAVHTEGVFELDGNATDDAAAGIDWQNVFNNPAAGQSFIPDATTAADTIFIGGGSKDVRDIPLWGQTLGSTPDKDDLENAFAALFTVNGEEIVYFGADRFSNSGDSAIGFWFFKSAITVNANGGFNGVHSVGDILVTSDFLQGGGASVINVFKWVGGNNPLTLLAHSEIKNGVPVGGTVDPVTGLFCTNDDVACAVANKSVVAAPWPYTFKGTAVQGTFPTGTFYEGGVNLTQLLGGSECFSNFLAMSRTSATTTAQLKDFVLGPFKNCSIAISKTCNVTRLTTAADNTPLEFSTDYTGVVTNTSDGALPVGTVITVRDDVGTPGTLADDQTQTFTLAAPLPKNGTQPFSGSFFTNDNPPHNTVFGTATFSGNTLSANFAIDCTPLPLSPNLSLTKNCNTVELVPDNGKLVAQVNVSGTVCNTSQTPGLFLNVTVGDDAVGIANPPDPATLFTGLLQPGACSDYHYTYQPNAGDGPTSPANLSMFSDTATAIGSNPALPPANQPTAIATAHCAVCPQP